MMIDHKRALCRMEIRQSASKPVRSRDIERYEQVNRFDLRITGDDLICMRNEAERV